MSCGHFKHGCLQCLQGLMALSVFFAKDAGFNVNDFLGLTKDFEKTRNIYFWRKKNPTSFLFLFLKLTTTTTTTTTTSTTTTTTTTTSTTTLRLCNDFFILRNACQVGFAFFFALAHYGIFVTSNGMFQISRRRWRGRLFFTNFFFKISSMYHFYMSLQTFRTTVFCNLLLIRNHLDQRVYRNLVPADDAFLFSNRLVLFCQLLFVPTNHSSLPHVNLLQ